MIPFDKRLVAQSQRPRWQKNDELSSGARDLAFLGGPGPFLIATAFMVVGKAANIQGAPGVGWRVTESVLLAASINAVGKGIAGRALPGVQTDHAFSIGRGFHDANGGFVSFPSGHTAAAFALATAITAEAERTGRRWGRYVRPIAYAAASGVAVARVYQHTHWASDLPMAAVIGMWSASTVERQSRLARAPRAKFEVVGPCLIPAGHHLLAGASIAF
jgi:membrane-associated phospholipid phosphatase